MKKVKGISINEFDKLCQERQMVGNKYGDSDEMRYSCWDILEELSDISNITGNRLVNRLIKQQGFVTDEQRTNITKVLTLTKGLLESVKELDSSIPDVYKTDENGGKRIVPDCLLEQVEIDWMLFDNSKIPKIKPSDLER